MSDSRLETWLAELGSPDEATRVHAAKWLADAHEVPVHAAGPLVKTLSDSASVSVEQSDWDGTVVGGSTYFARDHAAAALRKLGQAAIEAILAVEGHEALLVEVIVAAGPDRLGKMPAPLRDRVRQRLQGHWGAEQVSWALEWAETAPGDEALVRSHPDLQVVVEACERLAQKPDPSHALVVLERLGREDTSDYDERVGRVLEILAPLAGDADLTRFAQQAAASASWRVTSVLASLGPRVAAAGPKLLRRLMQQLARSINDSGVLARAVGLVHGPPRAADDVRVQHFLTAREMERGVMQPPREVLDTLVLACAGADRLAPWVLEPLIARLQEAAFDRRIDAARRLLALRTHASPAGPALEAALREELRGPRAGWSGTSDLAWTLSLAGEAAQKALPLFVDMLERPETTRTGLHALNGQSELFGAAIPALEAALSRATDQSLRTDIERTLKRVRHLSAQAQTKRQEERLVDPRLQTKR